jgi:hypothetical protein
VRQRVRGDRDPGQHKDRTDIIELIKAGIDVQACRAYLRAHAPGLAGAFEDAVARAAAEE